MIYGRRVNWMSEATPIRKTTCCWTGCLNYWPTNLRTCPPWMRSRNSTYDSEFGHSAGGIVSLQLKSGTNQIHGTAYYLGRNPALNAVPNSTSHTPSLVRNHIVGGSIGGPIKKNRIFNFTAYERWNNRQPITNFYTMPTALERLGDFSKSLNGNGGLRQIFDPLTTAFDPASNTSTRTPIPNNTIPASRIDPTSSRFLKEIWQPNNPGDDITGVNNYKFTDPLNITYWNVTSRTDFNVNDKWKTFFRYSQFRTGLLESNVTNSRAQPLNNFLSHSLNISGDAVWTINPTTVFNIRGAYISIIDSYDSPSKLSEKDLAEFWPGNPWYQSYVKDQPAIYFPGLQVRESGASNSFGYPNFWYQQPKTWNLQSKISKQEGRHYLKTGGEYRDQRIVAARPRLSGDGWGTFLLGTIDDASQIQTIPIQRPRVEFLAFYVQDDFKVSQRLTLNLGLRYEFETPMRDSTDRLSRFLDLSNPIPEFQTSPPQLPADVSAIRKAPPEVDREARECSRYACHCPATARLRSHKAGL